MLIMAATTRPFSFGFLQRTGLLQRTASCIASTFRDNLMHTNTTAIYFFALASSS